MVLTEGSTLQAPKVLKGKNRTLVQSLELLANVFDTVRDGINKGTVKIDAESKTVLLELDGLIESKYGEFWDIGEIKNGQGKLLVGIEETSAACLR